MISLIRIYNDTVHFEPIKVISDNTLFNMSITVATIDSRLIAAHDNLVVALTQGNMSEAMEHIGTALIATYDNTRTMIDMFNHIIRNFYSDDCSRQEEEHEEEREMGTGTEST